MYGSRPVQTRWRPHICRRRLDILGDRFKTYAAGGQPKDLALTDGARKVPARARNVYTSVIHEGKVRVPAAAIALIERVGPSRVIRMR